MIRNFGWQAIGFCFALAVATTFSTGCGSSVNSLEQNDPARIRMQSLAIMYASYLSHNGGKLPPNETELKKFISATGKSFLAERKIANLDELFVSPRDGQRLLVGYGTEKLVRGFSTDPIVAHEQTGVKGMRLVAFPSGAVVEVSPEMFGKLPIAKDSAHSSTSDSSAAVKP